MGIVKVYIDENILKKLDKRLTNALVDISSVDEAEVVYLERELKALKYFFPELTKSCDSVAKSLRQFYNDYQEHLEKVASEHENEVYGFNVLIEDNLHHFM